jgi:AraC-like DNA-binding protein
MPNRRDLMLVIVLALLACAERPYRAGHDRADERERMVETQIGARGVTDERVLAAMRTVRRHRYMPADVRARAYGDHPVPIGLDQTISLMARWMWAGLGGEAWAYRNGLRLRAALEPLAEGRTPLARLALDSGFSIQAHFCDAFRRAFGRTPASVRTAPDPASLREMSKILEDRRVA